MWRGTPPFQTPPPRRLRRLDLRAYGAQAQRDTPEKNPSYGLAMMTTVKVPFLSRVGILTRDIDIANLSICLSVRLSVSLSVTFRYQMKTA